MHLHTLLLLALLPPVAEARISFLGCYTDDAEDRHLKHGPEECGYPALLLGRRNVRVRTLCKLGAGECRSAA